jgi:hypothetical protein
MPRLIPTEISRDAAVLRGTSEAIRKDASALREDAKLTREAAHAEIARMRILLRELREQMGASRGA